MPSASAARSFASAIGAPVHDPAKWPAYSVSQFSDSKAGESMAGSRADSRHSAAGYRAQQGQRNATLAARAAAQQQHRRAPGLAQGAALGAAAAAVRR